MHTLTAQNLWMHAPEDRGDVPDVLLLLMEKEATNSDLVQDYRWMYSIALLRTPVGRVGEDLQEEVVDVLIANLGHHIQWRKKLLLRRKLLM